MEVNSKRLVGITHFRQQTTPIMEQVAEGRTFHLMRDSEVIGHIVPPNALVITTENLEYSLLGSLIDPAADDYARAVIQEGYLAHIGDPVGRALAWLWSSDPSKAMRWAIYYVRRFNGALRQGHYSRPSFAQLWFAVARGLGVTLRDADIDDFGQFLRTEIGRSGPELFSPVELAGDPRPRDDDDPWPDAVPNDPGRGYTKRRWCHLEVGQCIPNPNSGHTLPDDDSWYRIENIAGSEALLLQPDTGTTISVTVDNVATWLPVVSHQPYSWPNLGIASRR